MSKIEPFDLPFERFYLLVVDRLKIVIILQPQIFLVLVLPIFLNLLLLLEFLAGVLKWLHKKCFYLVYFQEGTNNLPQIEFVQSNEIYFVFQVMSCFNDRTVFWGNWVFFGKSCPASFSIIFVDLTQIIHDFFRIAVILSDLLGIIGISLKEKRWVEFYLIRTKKLWRILFVQNINNLSMSLINILLHMFSTNQSSNSNEMWWIDIDQNNFVNNSFLFHKLGSMISWDRIARNKDLLTIYVSTWGSLGLEEWIFATDELFKRVGWRNIWR